MVEWVGLIWTISIAVGTFFIYTFLPYLKTNIFKFKYYNMNMLFFLFEYELLGAAVANLISIVSCVMIGKSTWERLKKGEYIIAWVIVTIVYLVGIVIIERFTRELGKRRYITNCLLGFGIHFILSLQVILVNEGYNDNVFYFIAFGIFILQVILNIKVKEVRSVTYLIAADGIEYQTMFEPIKRGKFFHVREVLDEGKKERRIQIPEERIEKIEAIVEEKIDEKFMKSLLIIGAGEYGHLVMKLAEDCGYENIAFLDDNSSEAIGTVADATKWKDDYAEFVVAIGNPAVREAVVEALEGMFCLATLIHPAAFVSRSAIVEVGCIVEPGAVIQTAAKVGKACIINAGAVVNHNSTVMEYSQVDCNAVVGARAVVPKGTKINHA